MIRSMHSLRVMTFCLALALTLAQTAKATVVTFSGFTSVSGGTSTQFTQTVGGVDYVMTATASNSIQSTGSVVSVGSGALGVQTSIDGVVDGYPYGDGAISTTDLVSQLYSSSGDLAGNESLTLSLSDPSMRLSSLNLRIFTMFPEYGDAIIGELYPTSTTPAYGYWSGPDMSALAVDGGAASWMVMYPGGQLASGIILSHLDDTTGLWSYQFSNFIGISNLGFGIDSLSFSDEVDDGSTVPEPATLSLIGLGLAGAGALRRRKPRAH